MLNQISMLQSKALLSKPQIASLADKFSQYFVMAVLVISLASYIVWVQIDESQALWVTISILIATCPCALGLATPSALSCAVAHLNSKGILLKRADALEQISQVDWVALDKTGTLTEGKFTLVDCFCVEEADKRFCLEIAASLEQYSSHPIANAFSEIPKEKAVLDFSMSIGKGIMGNIDGINYKLGSLHFVGTDDLPESMLDCNVFLSAKDTLLCGFVLTDKIRESSAQLIQKIEAEHLTLLSGDIC